MECLDDASLHLDFTFVSLVSGHPRPPVVTAPVYRGCPCRDPLGCLPMPGIGSRAPTLVVALCKCGGHAMWTLLIHAFYKQVNSSWAFFGNVGCTSAAFLSSGCASFSHIGHHDMNAKREKERREKDKERQKKKSRSVWLVGCVCACGCYVLICCYVFTFYVWLGVGV